MDNSASQPSEAIHPPRSQSIVGGDGGGVYTLRSREASAFGVAAVRPSDKTKEFIKDVGVDSETGSVDSRDIKRRQVFHGWKLLWLAYQSIGVIYGDIGTSPLYVYSSTFSSPPSREDLLGACSWIIWSLTIMVTIKYCFIVLRADDEGEGGTFALFSLLTRYANIVRRHPREAQMVRMERHMTGDLRKPARTARNLMERSSIVQWILKVLGVFGVALVMSDGVLTPAQSVLGAIQGIEVVSSNITQSTVIGSSCAILVVLFLLQPFGITKLASTFAPIVIVWLLFNAIFGIYNLAKHDASMLKAFSPYFAGNYLVRNGREGWINLGGILLAFTGCETLYADLGAFSAPAVRLSWLYFAYPCLLLSYIGQAAYLSDIPDAYNNPFFKTVPPGCVWPSLIIAILAAIVASQATITATFQLLTQIMKLSYFPQLKVVHVSKIFYGQIYMPIANWLLMTGTIVVTAAYTNTTNLGHAYGVCVILVTFLTTNMVAVVALIVWRYPLYVVAPVWLIFALWDGIFLSSALTKVPSGAWFTLALGVILVSFFILWRFGKEQQWKAEGFERIPTSDILQSTDSKSEHSRKLKLAPAFGNEEITRINGIGVFFDKSGAPSTTPTAFIHFLQKFHAAPDVIIFFHLRPLEIPTVPAEERYQIIRCFMGNGQNGKKPMPNCYRVIIRHGYNDEVVSQNLGLLLHDQVHAFLSQEGLGHEVAHSGGHMNGSKHVVLGEKAVNSENTSLEQSELTERLTELQQAFSKQVVYIVGKEQLRVKGRTNIVRRAVLEAFLWVRENTRTKIQALNIPVDKLVEVGFIKEI
ncbi:potassium uptake protein [Cladophialophora bantiana CBS 173.52]|uniref:Potassium uptake protein n=1 Tax=Cladophialophora bantiana (strain ATCC 10958 / CBS 173.52 / CDC B-1940 / NIH 8579) TaxID=1442370 RepID=A0A0D2G8P9_CLAB1|nr:potassium uptake protein [Cladophialophora bantiana CBS 173.52]KIW94967.1 potassium uptake protein [Cladophialophora bantiana CBS 173.52]